MLKQTLLYTGKAKSVYETDSADHLILVFRDDASAFNGAGARSHALSAQ